MEIYLNIVRLCVNIFYLFGIWLLSLIYRKSYFLLYLRQIFCAIPLNFIFFGLLISVNFSTLISFESLIKRVRI